MEFCEKKHKPQIETQQTIYHMNFPLIQVFPELLAKWKEITYHQNFRILRNLFHVQVEYFEPGLIFVVILRKNLKGLRI